MSKALGIFFETFTRGGDNYAKHILGTPGHSGDHILTRTHPQTGEFFAAVMDGAISPYPFKIEGESTDAFASRIMAKLLELSVVEESTLSHASEVIERAIPRYASIFDTFRHEFEAEFRLDGTIGPKDNLTAKVWNPACAFAVACFHNDGSISIAQATDCTISAIYKDGRIEVLTADRHIELIKQGKLKDTNGPGLPQDRIANGEDPWDILLAELEMNRYNRRTAYNQPGGIGVFNGETELMTSGCLHTQVIPATVADQIDKLVLVSDGMTPGRHNLEAVVHHIATHGAEDYYENILVPHFKGANPIPTDASSILVQL